MSHHVYTTDAFILDSNPSGEANKSYLIFTKELGMIRGTAQGVRLLKSKLRFSLQDFSRASVSTVRGKDIWRVTNAKLTSNLYETHKERKEIVTVIAHVFSLMKRLMPGEEKHEKLFDVLARALDFLETEKNLVFDDVTSFECILVLNILFELGYLAPGGDLSLYIEPVWSRELLMQMVPQRKHAYQEINKSLKETQL